MAIRHLQLHVPKFTPEAALFSVGLMIFFFVIFDGVLMYLAPIIITESGISASMMGLIIGSSSVAGMLFDLVLCRAFADTNYRRMFLLMLIVAALYPLFLFGGTTVSIYIIAMAMWGFYYDFYNIGTLDFVGRTTEPSRHAASFGVLRVFEGSGYLLAPFAGSILLIYLHPGPLMLLAVVLPLLLSALLYFAVVVRRGVEMDQYVSVPPKDALSFLTEMRLWETLGILLLPILSLTLTINVIDAAIWTIGPLFSQHIGEMNGFPGGVLMTAYALPPLLVGWVIGMVTRRLGMKYTAQAAIGVGSLLLVCIGLVSSPYFLIGLVFMASFFLSVGWPSINAIYTEHVDNTPTQSKEIQTLQDLFTNFGDIAGPIAGGYMAQYLGYTHSFIALGVLGVGIAVSLFMITPRTVPVYA